MTSNAFIVCSWPALSSAWHAPRRARSAAADTPLSCSKDGAELSYPASVAYKKCPQRTLKFYECHLHFRRAPNDS
jgi:hypothetical protein